MVRGSLTLYDTASKANILLKRFIDTPLARLGGLQSSTEYSITVEPPTRVNPIRAYLEIGMIVADRVLTKWRLWVNRIAVTREFKPTVLLKLEDRGAFYAKTMYDLTPVLASVEAPYRIVVQYEGSPEVELTDVSLTTLYPDEDSTTSYILYSGAVALEPGEEHSIELPSDLSNANLSLVIGFPSKLAQVTIRCGDTAQKVAGLVGYHEIGVTCRNRLSTVKLIYHRPQYPFYPKTLIVSSLALEQSTRREPVMDIAVSKLEGGRAVVTVRNNGSSKPEMAMLIIISRGSILRRIDVGGVEPGQSIELAVDGVPEGALLRLVWRFKGETRVREVRVRR
jgi:hypothetical protein